MKNLFKNWKKPTTKAGKVLRVIGGIVMGGGLAGAGGEVSAVEPDNTALIIEAIATLVGAITALIGQLQAKK